MRPSEINVQYRGGYRGPYIDIRTLIEKRVKLTVIDFQCRKSQMRDVESYTHMQIRISGKLCVTWHTSAVLANYLEDCRAQSQMLQEELGCDPGIFPINDCIIVEGEDRGYYRPWLHLLPLLLSSLNLRMSLSLSSHASCGASSR